MIGVPFVVGVNYVSAPVEVRERLAIVEEEATGVLDTMAGIVHQGAILATCNRTELYAICMGEDSINDLRLFFGSWQGISTEDVAPYIYSYTGPEAVRHLFRVSAGIDSMVVGEAQILSQVKDALRIAEAAGRMGKELKRLFTHAIRAGRRARAETAIGRNGTSIPDVAVELARKVLGSLQGHRALIVGAGNAGKLSAKALLGAGAAEVFVINRTDHRSLDLASNIGGRAIPFSSLENTLAEVDVVVSGTAAKEPVISLDAVESAMTLRQGSPLLMLDIAVPRDIDPSVAGIHGVYLYNIDQLHAAARSNHLHRHAEVEQAEQIVAQEMDRFMEWWRTLIVIPTLRELLQTAERVRQLEMDRVFRKLSHLSLGDQQTVEMMSRALIKKLLHHPLLSLKEMAEDEGHIETIRHVFHLSERNGDADL